MTDAIPATPTTPTTEQPVSKMPPISESELCTYFSPHSFLPAIVIDAINVDRRRSNPHASRAGKAYDMSDAVDVAYADLVSAHAKQAFLGLKKDRLSDGIKIVHGIRAEKEISAAEKAYAAAAAQAGIDKDAVDAQKTHAQGLGGAAARCLEFSVAVGQLITISDARHSKGERIAREVARLAGGSAERA